VWYALLAVGACGKAPEQAARQVDSATMPVPPLSELAYLRGYVGKYPGDTAFWDSEPLRGRMTRLLGGDYEAFRNNIKTSGPISEAGGLVYVTGNCPSSSREWGAAALIADPTGNKLVLKLYTEKNGLRSFSDGEITTLPQEVNKTLGVWEDRPKPTAKTAPRKKPTETKG
jgi:hypothetical protein